MSISEMANKNHEALFPNRKSTLAETEADLIEVFDNFAFDEVLQYGNLDARTRLMVILSSMIASQALEVYKVILGGALNVGVTPIEVKEIVYQAVPYVGIAKVYDFIHATNDILESCGVKLPVESQSTTTPEIRFEKGLAVQKAIFGDYLTRTGIEVKTRELLTFSMLLSLGGWKPQLKGHIQGNLNIGNDKGVLLSVVTQLIPYVGYPRALNAIRCLNEVVPE